MLRLHKLPDRAFFQQAVYDAKSRYYYFGPGTWSSFFRDMSKHFFNHEERLGIIECTSEKARCLPIPKMMAYHIQFVDLQ